SSVNEAAAFPGFTRHSRAGGNHKLSASHCSRPCSILIESKLGPNLLFYRDFRAVECSISLEITLAVSARPASSRAGPDRQDLPPGDALSIDRGRDRLIAGVFRRPVPAARPPGGG